MQPFESACKPTCNTKVPKRVSDLFQSTKLNDLHHLWTGKCSIDNKLAVNYDCSLREYGDNKRTPNFRYIGGHVRYKSTIDPPNYTKEQVVCDKFRRELKQR